MLSERQQSILGAVVREYVDSAEPVASAELVRRWRLPMSPATVRNELQALDEAGYLSQPHTSAGRVPTDKGYRFFISHLATRDGLESREERLLRELADLDDPGDFARRASRLMAQLTQTFALAGFPEEAVFYHAGLHEVMRSPEFADVRLVREFGELVDTIEEEIGHCLVDPEELDDPRTFIGAENPIRLARHYGMIVSAVQTPSRKESVVALIGPKRMDYEHDLALLRHFREMLTQ